MQVNDKVCYISGRYSDNEYAPLYNGKLGQVVGLIHEIDNENSCAFVSFNGHLNWFGMSDLVLINSICLAVPTYLALANIALLAARPIGYPTVGDKVVYVSGRYGDSSSNPCWPLRKHSDKPSIGTLRTVNDPSINYRCRVEWVDTRNTYLLEDLRAINDHTIQQIKQDIQRWIKDYKTPKPNLIPELILPKNRIKGVFNV